MITNKEKQHMKEVLEELSKELKDYIVRNKNCCNDGKRGFEMVETLPLFKLIDELTKKTISKHGGKPLEDEA